MSFDWSSLKGAIGNVLPAIASVIGTPLAGGAVKTLCNALGLKDDSSPTDIEAAYQSATPEQLIRLKELDSIERIRMEEISAYNTNSAREMAKEMVKAGAFDWTPRFLVMATVSMLFILTVACLFINQDTADTTIINNVIQTLTNLLLLGFGYYFGSSSSSRNKDATISELKNK
jgi:hypothetical protein